eukprot:CAMPEP_0198360280 /NCGR_PEP_ID=MMETSP1450-20131203/137744_1 /TAXON_ID=753684 ORGANISM="Madagascaria erythrocladiodes, Strain CCMP3234" /NCGR_SAMPLE_ID=MMETSP1450 /ASSEMBLY_ACC=CAM_ASM_001115 /LENGTH=393 /DNA_ID=CAMNT_0044067265 /DNA_START=61 /DNA_END=1242 /DNA_ORIENTATION=+
MAAEHQVHPALTMLRYFLAAAVTVLTVPLLVFLRLPLPDTSLTRSVHRAGVFCLAIVTAIARIDCHFIAPCDRVVDPAADARPDRPTLAAMWCSPLPMPATTSRRTKEPSAKQQSSLVVRTYDQPGTWMSDDELHKLQQWMRQVAEGSMGIVPSHRIFLDDPRDVLTNRVVSVAFDNSSGDAVAFSAMVYLPYRPGEYIVHLGLTMIAKSHRGRRLQSPLFTKCLVMAMFNLGTLSYRISNIGASPAGIGAVSDYFFNVYPHYLRSTRRSRTHVDVARHVLRNYRHEFACSHKATFDETTFVVAGSNEQSGGGCYEMIKQDNQPVSQHRSDSCNQFCADVLDLRRGDELFQVGTVDLVGTSLKYIWSSKGSKKTKSESFPSGRPSTVRANSPL